MHRLGGLLVVSFIAIASPLVMAGVRLASPFTDHMVLQRGKPLVVWGGADADSEVAVTLGDRHATVKADAAGRWSATLEALPAGGPMELTASGGGTTAKADDILIGDVFLCSGQSNLQYSLGETADYAATVAKQLPKLRLGKVDVATATEPKDALKVQWSSASPTTAKGFSAVAYTMAYELYKQDPKLADLPVGLLEDCLGGTVIESWLPKSELSSFDPKTLASSMFGIGPSLLYNGMIAPLGQLPLAGVVWYQGEGNGGEPARYAQYLPRLMSSWRKQLAQPELPFMIVQLPDYATDWGGVYWQWIRESQAKAATSTPNAAYVVTLNTNDGWNLHPQGKHEIGRRLAMLIREVVYHEQVPGRSPTFKSAKIDDRNVRVTFDVDGSTLTSGTEAVDGFALAGEDGVYHTADAVIDGADTVVVNADAVPNPKTIRYAWAGVPRSTLANAVGLPAAPFRTDDQPSTKGRGEIQQAPTGYVFKARRYQMAIDGNGRATSLVVNFKQLLSNADGPWGGMTLTGPGGTRSLSDITANGLDGLSCAGGGLSASVHFGDDAIHWTITNSGKKDAVRLNVAISPQAEVTYDSGTKTATVHRKDAKATFTNVDRVTAFNDPAADTGGKVLEISVPAGEMRAIEISVVH